MASFHFISLTFSFPAESSRITLIQAVWFKNIKSILSMTGKSYKNVSSLSVLSERKSFIQYENQKTKSSRLEFQVRITWSALCFKLRNQFQSVSSGNLLAASSGKKILSVRYGLVVISSTKCPNSFCHCCPFLFNLIDCVWNS